jgi:hypothetical protein
VNDILFPLIIIPFRFAISFSTNGIRSENKDSLKTIKLTKKRKTSQSRKDKIIVIHPFKCFSAYPNILKETKKKKNKVVAWQFNTKY